MTTTNKVILFWGGTLSNWASTPYTSKGKQYCCSEQQYMEAKALYFKDHESATKIMESTDPKEIKHLGRMVKNYNDAEWSMVRMGYMLEAVRAKFNGNKRAHDFLMKQPADHIFAEASPYDRIWGIGLTEHEPDALDLNRWPGQNLLGQAITIVYKELQTNLFNNGINS